MRNRVAFIRNTSISLVLIVLISCTGYNYTPGRAEIVSVEEVQLGDSVLFVGYVRDVFSEDTMSSFWKYQVWLEPSNIQFLTDTVAYYEIKTIPGTYTIQCKMEREDRPELISSIRNYMIKKNEKVHIDFYIGDISE